MRMIGYRIVGLALLMLMMMGCGTYPGEESADQDLDRRVDSVLELMSLEEKLGQLSLLTSDWDVTGPTLRKEYMEDIRSGKCGNIFNAHTVAYNRELQRIAMEETRLGIPLLFGYDVIHGHRTIFPIPLAEACSWNLELMGESARLAAKEAAASGLNWTFAPMVDIARDPRWGRVSEGSGEDSYLGSLIAEARVKGFQGEDLADPLSLAACIKHFAAYGAPVAGRDYNTVDMSEIAFRSDYLPPYRAGIDAGAATVMASFNDLFGVPATASHYLMTEILRDEWGFDGFVVSDYTGVEELLNHGVAGSRQHAGELALSAGVDMDMQSVIFAEDLVQALDQGKVSMEEVDLAVRRVLAVKFRLGLFADPYRYMDEEREAAIVHSEELMQHALLMARESVVLLRNESIRGENILPLDAPGRIAVIGPMADNQMDMLGSWHAAGDIDKVVTVSAGLQQQFPSAQVEVAQGCGFYGEDRSGFKEALALARRSDVVVLAIGENQAQSGEAASRSTIDIPGKQEELALELINTGTPVIVMIMAERPLVFPELNEKASAILYAWHLGTRAGDALADILSGDYNPSGKLAMSIPVNEGQIPIYYNAKASGRPFNASDKYTSKYLDVSNKALYPFGFGLSYSSFEYGEIHLDREKISMNDSLVASVIVRNTGEFGGQEVVQLYVHDLLGSLTRPVRELKGFRKISLEAGESREISFSLCEKDLRFINGKLEYMTEAGEFEIFIGTDSETRNKTVFTLTN